MNGKRFAWQVNSSLPSPGCIMDIIIIINYQLTNFFVGSQGIAKLPFIDERKLLAQTKKLESTLTVCYSLFRTIFYWFYLILLFYLSTMYPTVLLGI